MQTLNLFFFYSIVGYILESLLIKGYISGILFLPWTPIYGVGILIAIYIYKKINKKYNIIIELLLHFVLCALVLSIIEFIGGYMIELIFKKVYWNYDYLKYNLGKYVSLESALIWGLGSTLSVYLLNPPIEKLLLNIPSIIPKILTFIIIIDIILTFIVKAPLS